MTVLLLASSGGHITELVELAPRLDVDIDDALWVTFDTPQTRSLLEGRRVRHVPAVASRDLLGVLRNVRTADRILRGEPFDAIVSTGAAIAMSYFPIARLRGVPSYYIESAARTDGPSMTGRLLAAVPRVHRSTQYEGWAGGKWQYAGSVFDNFTVAPGPAPRPIRRVLVTLGTSSYNFTRLAEQLERVLPDDVELTWQLGAWDHRPARGEVRGLIAADELARLHHEADVVIAHAGVGSALVALREGHAPVLVPRLAAFGEVVDDHQLAIAENLDRRGVAVGVDAGELTMAHLERAAARRVERATDAPPIRLRR